MSTTAAMRKPILLVAFLALLTLGVILMWLSDRTNGSAQEHLATEPKFPSRFSGRTYERIQRRLTLAPAPSAESTASRDPLFVALPDEASTAVVFEASAIRDSQVGQLAMKCLTRYSESEKSRDGKNVMQFAKNLDRLAITNGLYVATGDFSGVDWTREGKPSDVERAYGNQGKIRDGKDIENNGPAVATHGTSMVLIGEKRSEVEQSIDQLEDRKPASERTIEPGIAYGDIYGQVDASSITRLLPPEIAEIWNKMAKSVELHVDVQDDVLIVADVTGPDTKGLDELGRTIAGALSLARLHAKATGDQKLGQILEYAKITPNQRDFRIEIALPAALVKQALGPCAFGPDAGPL